MAKQRESSTSNDSSPALPWSPRTRGIVSIFLAFHVAAVFIGPWSTPPPTSGLSQRVADGIEPYLRALALHNGYRFFAPNPGPSHLMHYRLHLRDGSTKEGRFPDLEEQWPRQLYHRYFMVAETVDKATAGLFPQPMPPNEDPEFMRLPPAQRRQALAEYQTAGRRQNEVKKELLQPIAQRLMIEHDAETVELWCLQHEIPSREEFLSGAALTDERLYLHRPLGIFHRR